MNMKKEIINHSEILLLGITARTNNKSEAESETAKILPTVQQYFHNALANKIVNRVTPNTTYCVYTDYASDEFGDYTNFIGEAVNSVNSIPEGFSKLIIPAQKYVKFTNGPGTMPDVCINAWKTIWKMPSAELGGNRAYLADYEIYDERASNHHNVEIDIYVGITN
jgi:predicted transcriptional regulator YdeE